MQTVTDLDTLHALYGDPAPIALTKVRQRITPKYREWIEAARFTVLSTVGEEGTDASPRGDKGPVVRIADDRTLLLPDWLGNNRIDSLKNIVTDGRVSLMFMVPGCNNVVRVNGRAVLCVEPEVLESFTQGGRHPRSVIVVRLEEIYVQCAKALMRSELWSLTTPRPDVPSAGAFLKEVDAGFDGDSYDAGYPEYAKTRFW